MYIRESGIGFTEELIREGKSIIIGNNSYRVIAITTWAAGRVNLVFDGGSITNVRWLVSEVTDNSKELRLVFTYDELRLETSKVELPCPTDGL